MKTNIKKSVIPFGAIVAAAMFLFVAVLSLTVSKTTLADNGQAPAKGKMLTIYDRGAKKIIVTQKSTIGEALKEAGISIDSKDVVEPAVSEKLVASDYQVNIYRARPVLIIDGASRIKITTAYQTAAQIVQSAGITLYDEDKTSVSTTSDVVADGVGLQVAIDRAVPINFTLYGRATQVRTHAATVGKMLQEKGIELNSSDFVSPGTDTPIAEGLNVQVWREGKQIITVDETIPFETETIEDADKRVDYREIKVVGENGLRSVSYEATIRDGVEVSRTEIASITISSPKKQTEVIGVKGNYSTPSENETIAWDYFIAAGLSRVQAAGIMGNLMQEHRFNTSDASGGFGIAQWTGGRRESIMSLPNSENIYVQLDFLMSELSGGYSYVLDSIKSTNSIESVVEIFQDEFERCNPYYCMQDQRIDYARDILASH